MLRRSSLALSLSLLSFASSSCSHHHEPECLRYFEVVETCFEDRFGLVCEVIEVEVVDCFDSGPYYYDPVLDIVVYLKPGQPESTVSVRSRLERAEDGTSTFKLDLEGEGIEEEPEGPQYEVTLYLPDGKVLSHQGSVPRFWFRGLSAERLTAEVRLGENTEPVLQEVWLN